MWQRYILPSAALLALVIFPAMLSASAEPFPTVTRGDVYTEELVRINPDGSRIVKWTSSPPRIFHNGEYKDYVLYQDAGIVRLETGNAGSLVFNKSTCSYDFYEAGLITQSSVPAVKNISWTVKGKLNTAGTWSSVSSVNSAACNVTVSAGEKTVRITGEKSSSAGTFQIVLDYSPGRGIKETMRAYNNNAAWNSHNIGFTETFEVPRMVQFGGREFDLSLYNGTILGRTWIENNEAYLTKFTDTLFYDFGIGYDNLETVRISWDGSTAKLSMNYLFVNDIVPYQQWFEVDPTFGYDAAQSQQSVYTGVTAQCATAPGTTNNTAASTTFSIRLPSTGAADNCVSQLAKFIITSIPDSVTVQSGNLRHDRGAAGGSSSVLQMVFRNVTLDPQGSATPAQKWVQMSQGNFVVSPYTEPAANTNNIVTPLNSNGTTAIQNALVQNYIGFAPMFVSMRSDASLHLIENLQNFELEVTYILPLNPNRVTDLAATVTSSTSADLDWTQPTLNAGSLVSYQINLTNPFGAPLTIIANNSGTGTAYSLTGLVPNTNYSARVGVQTTSGYNGSGNIANFTTVFIPANFTIGSFNFNAENPDITPIRFERTDHNSTATTLTVIYDSSYDMSCEFEFEFARSSSTFYPLTPEVYDTSHNSTDFTFLDPASEVVQARCWDVTSNATARYVITQTAFPLLDQLANFRAGTYGTSGEFGAFDLITLAVVIVSMIGFNRINESVGGIINISLLAALAYFEIITLPTVIFGVIAVVVLVIISTTKKD